MVTTHTSDDMDGVRESLDDIIQKRDVAASTLQILQTDLVSSFLVQAEAEVKL